MQGGGWALPVTPLVYWFLFLGELASVSLLILLLVLPLNPVSQELRALVPWRSADELRLTGRI